MPKQEEGILITIVVASVFFVLIGVFLMILVFFFLRRQRKFKMEKDEMRNQYEQTLLNTQLEIQEQTFNYVSQEIHDNIGQILSLVRINLNVIASKSPEINFDQTDELLGKAIRDLRLLSHNLNSNRVRDIGIVDGLRSLLSQLDKTEKYRTHFIAYDNALSSLNSDTGIILYRMVQEVLHNIIKHANASEVSIEIQPNGNNSDILTISDNGRGFDTGILQETKNGIGLKNIFTRAKMIHANVAVKSEVGSGTCVIFELINTPPEK